MTQNRVTDLYFFTHADNELAIAGVVRPHPALLDTEQHGHRLTEQNAAMLERVFTISDFYRGFDNRTLKAVSRGFEMEFDFRHHDGAARVSGDYLSERIEMIRQILDDRDGEDIHYINRKGAKPVKAWKGGRHGG